MAKIDKPRPIVRIETGPRRSPWRWVLALALPLIVVAVYLWQSYDLHALLQEPSRQIDAGNIAALEQEVLVLRERNAQLERELAFVKRSSMIDKEANRELTESLAEQQKKVLQTSEELNFYKNIVSEDGAEQALEIRDFEIDPGNEAGQAAFKLVVTRSGAKKSTIKGRVELRVQGRQADRNKTLGWKQISADAKKILSFSFQYFQKIEGELKFPEGFIPENVLVKLVPKGKIEPVQQSYSWNSVTKEAT